LLLYKEVTKQYFDVKYVEELVRFFLQIEYHLYIRTLLCSLFNISVRHTYSIYKEESQQLVNMYIRSKYFVITLLHKNN